MTRQTQPQIMQIAQIGLDGAMASLVGRRPTRTFGT